MTLQKVLGKRSIPEYVKYLLKETKFTDEKKVEKFFEKEDKMEKDDDPLLEAATIFVNRYHMPDYLSHLDQRAKH
ncbi:MAG: S46 family peptidase [Saprospiraceae bacterium]